MGLGITTIVGTRRKRKKESGATPPTLTQCGSTVMFLYVELHI